MTSTPTNRWVVLATLVVGTLGAGLTIGIIALGVEPIAEDLDASTTLVSWGVTGAILGSLVGSSIIGKVADVRGRREVYLLCIAGLVVALPLTAAATNGAQFVALRVLGGVATGGASSSAAAMLYQTFPGDDRSKAIGVFTAVMTGAPAVGILLGGPAIDSLGWQTLFVGLGALALVALLAGVAVLPASPASDPYPIDFAGGVLGAGGIALLLVGVTVGAAEGWSAAPTLSCFGIGIASLVAFTVVERTVRHPIVRLDYLRRRNFILPTLVSATNSFAYMGGLVISPILLTSVFGYSITEASGVLFVRPAMYSIFSAVGGFLLPRVGGRRILIVSAAMLSISLLVQAVATDQARIELLVIGLLLAGMGAGAASSSVATLTADASDPADYGMATGMRGVLIQIGVTGGIQTLTVMLGADRDASAFIAPFVLAAGVAAVGILIAMLIQPADRVRE